MGDNSEHRAVPPSIRTRKIVDIVADVYRSAEEIGIQRVELDKKEESLKEKHPCMLSMIAFAKESALT